MLQGVLVTVWSELRCLKPSADAANSGPFPASQPGHSSDTCAVLRRQLRRFAGSSSLGPRRLRARVVDLRDGAPDPAPEAPRQRGLLLAREAARRPPLACRRVASQPQSGNAAVELRTVRSHGRAHLFLLSGVNKGDGEDGLGGKQRIANSAKRSGEQFTSFS